MKVRYQGGFDEVLVPLPSGIEIRVERGGVAEFPDAYAALLVEQDVWVVVDSKASKKAAADAAEGA